MDWEKHFHAHKHPFAIAAGIVFIIVVLAHWLGPVEPAAEPMPTPTPTPVTELQADTNVVSPK